MSAITVDQISFGQLEREYRAFLESKRVLANPVGFEVAREDINPMFFDFQADVAMWDLRRGKAANFLATGLGKGPIAMEFCKHVSRHTGGDTMILAPLAVAQQFQREAVKFHYQVTLCQDQSDVRAGINITNYDRMGKFDLESFAGVAMDESSCIRDWTSKTTRTLIDRLSKVPFKLCSTATPSPNDHAELGNHAELLDVMTRTQMLAMFFEHDGGDASKWVLKGHGKKPFFKFVASWGVFVLKPSDLGYPNDGYDLPPLNLYEHVVPVDWSINTDGKLFRDPSLSSTDIHKEMRITAEARAQKTAELVYAKPDEQWIIWCNTDYEADAVRTALPEVFEVRGPETPEKKEAAIMRFLDGDIRWLVTKPSIFGWGMNLQCCHNMVSFLNYSFESLFQAIRRSWRFGQLHPVNVHLVTAETEGPVLNTMRRKERQHEELQCARSAVMREEQLLAKHKITNYEHTMEMRLPSWL
jgi:hypothetical protein